MRVLITAGVRWWNASAHYAVDLGRALEARGHEVLVAARRGTPAAERAAAAGLEVDDGFDFRPQRFLADTRRMARLLSRRPFDVLNPHRADDQNVILVAARLARVPTPVLRTRVDVKEMRPSLGNRAIYRLLTGVVAPAECSRSQILRRYGVPPARVETVHAGVDTEMFDPRRRDGALRRSLGIPDDRPAIGIVARLGTIKGHVHFFDAIGRLAAGANGHGPVAIVVGQETDHSIAELREEAARRGARDVLFTGYRRDIAETMACLDVGVVASIGSEAHCRVGLELFASGVPVVGTDVGVVPELIDEGRNGFVVAPGDGAALADRIRRLLASTDERRAFALAARSAALERFTFAAWAHRTEEAFRRLTDAPPPRS